MKRFLSLLGVSLLFALPALADGTISGRVADDKTSEPLIGVEVVVKGQPAKGAVTDIDGNYTIAVPPGTYELEIRYLGYTPKSVTDVVVQDGAEVAANLTLSEASSDKTVLGEVVVKGSLKKENINAMVAFQKNTNTVAQVVSAEAIRRSPDKNTGEVLKRVSGASIQEGKYLVVRGLADRYNAAMLNGALLTSTEPDRKTFSFDLFPANIIDNIVINKAAVPELPGEFAGGLVQVNTRDIPSENFFTIQLGTGFNTQTIGKNFTRNNVGGTDWLGVDDGSRALPGQFPGTRKEYTASPAQQQAEFARMLPNNWALTTDKAPLNVGGQATGGYTKKFGRGTFGAIGSLNYSKNNRRVETSRFDFNEDGSPVNRFAEERFAQDVVWGGLANLAYNIGKSKISWRNLYNLTANNWTTTRTGTDITNGPFDLRQYELAFITNRIFSSQLGGEHVLGFLGNTKARWNGSYTRLTQNTPDLRRLTYQTGVDPNTNQPDGIFIANVPAGSASISSSGRFFSDLADDIYSGSGDLSKGFKLGDVLQTVKVGGMYLSRSRTFVPRALGYISDRSNPDVRDGIVYLPIETLFSPENMAPNKLTINETTQPQDAYNAASRLTAGYLQFDNSFLNRFQISWGARVESYYQQIEFTDRNLKATESDTIVTDILPSANLKFALNDKTNIRLSASQTVTRPEFREIAPFNFYNFDLFAVESGNTQLQRTKVTNADLRYEIYPSPGEFATVGVFYKNFVNPIERYYNTTGGGSAQLVYLNAEGARSAGVEGEFRKSLGFLKPSADEDAVLNNLFVFANGAYIYNRVRFPDGSTLETRPMQGQSNYVLNGGVMADVRKTGTNFSLLVNRVGRRIFLIGDQRSQPDIWEAPRTLLDVQVTQRFLQNGEVKLAVSDLLNQYQNFYEDINKNGTYDGEGGADFLRIRSRYGRNVSLSVAYKLPVKRKREAESVTTP